MDIEFKKKNDKGCTRKKICTFSEKSLSYKLKLKGLVDQKRKEKA